MKQTLPVVAIVGRPNVGKSALFNRLIQRRQALVDATPGLTRDRIYGDVQWQGIAFRVVDTGGLQFPHRDRIEEAIASQVTHAMEETSLALLVCDGREGVVPLDRQVAAWVRRWDKPVLLVVNKADTDREIPAIHEFSELGLGTPWAISSLHGLGVGDLLDEVVSQLKPAADLGKEEDSAIRVAIVGRPNVGKSSLLNCILKEDRVLVDEQPGTTRDPVEAEFSYRGQRFCWIDTAGIRSRRTLKSQMDAVVRMKALEMIVRSHVSLGVLEAPLGIVRDDLTLLDQVITAGKPLCLAVNKWDLMPRSTDLKTVTTDTARRAPFLRFAPVICTSAKTGFQVLKMIEKISDVVEQSNRRLSGGQLKELLEAIQQDSRTPVGLRNAQLIRLWQVSVRPPTFHLLARVKRGFRATDMTFLENLLRKKGGYMGTPIRIRLLAKQR